MYQQRFVHTTTILEIFFVLVVVVVFVQYVLNIRNICFRLNKITRMSPCSVDITVNGMVHIVSVVIT